MNSNELRIGNYLYRRVYNPIPGKEEYYFDKVKVVGVLKDVVYFNINNKNQIFKSSSLKPIKLTEEILLKCKGIIKHHTIKNRYLSEDSNYSFHIEDGDWNNPCLDVLINGMYIICVEFLHEFQNLIYTLTNQELDIEL